ncbi:P-loop containing nucleoside triphosphate hydrolase protein [Podospora conica]|nr:P-loop containing nucleoside triphosphate hydrolase protein [Schizothecium conicum]
MVSQPTHRQGQKKGEVFIAVIGVTGAGKTTFISRATGRTDLEIGHGIDSCTQDVIPVAFTLDGQPVTLFDTPGFDDSERSDADILNLVANYMARSYEQGMLLTGVIFVQPISQQRLLGSETRRNRLFKKILGEDAYSHVMIATTMWNQVPEREAESRMDQRRNRDDIWGDMVKLGAKVVRHDDNAASATKIVQTLIDLGSPVELLLQKELVENGGKVGHTSAGRQHDEDLGEVISKLRKEMEDLKKERQEMSEEMAELRRELEVREQEVKKIRDGDVCPQCTVM